MLMTCSLTRLIHKFNNQSSRWERCKKISPKFVSRFLYFCWALPLHLLLPCSASNSSKPKMSKQRYLRRSILWKILKTPSLGLRKLIQISRWTPFHNSQTQIRNSYLLCTLQLKWKYNLKLKSMKAKMSIMASNNNTLVHQTYLTTTAVKSMS